LSRRGNERSDKLGDATVPPGIVTVKYPAGTVFDWAETETALKPTKARQRRKFFRVEVVIAVVRGAS
jgi:hypothetical protein